MTGIRLQVEGDRPDRPRGERLVPDEDDDQADQGRRARRAAVEPGMPCRGTLRVIRRRHGGYDLRYRELSRSTKCTGNDRIFIRRRGKRLLWRATAPGGAQVGRALLRRA